jgi:1-deoxy-D-xylulose-5-phosphate reductoisomerase
MSDAVKRLAILGSTGSIGRQALDVVRALPERFRVVGLAAGANTDLLAEQVREFKPEFFCYSSAHKRGERADSGLGGAGGEFLPLEDMARHPDVDTVVIAVSGTAGLGPTLAAVKAGKHIALANKESLVTAGEVIMGEAGRTGARILPVDSEHSAVWQCLNGEKQAARRIILTASGGPFRHYSAAQMQEVTVAQALAHPSWQMGKKVTIDSATLMNKGLEVIEAHWLFDMPIDDIAVLVHPQSIVHSMVEFIDGSVKAQLSCPDMRLPIQYALSYPDRLANPRLPRLDWGRLSSLAFERPDLDRFPCLGLAVAAGKDGGTCPAVLAAADEVAVEMFISGRIRLVDIARIVEKVLEQHRKVARPVLEEIMTADAWARETALKLVSGDN